MGDTEENWVTPQHGPSHYLKNRLQLKKKEDVGGGGSGMGGYQAKLSKQGCGSYTDLSHFLPR